MGLLNDVIDTAKGIATTAINKVSNFISDLFKGLSELAKTFWTKTHSWVKKALSAVTARIREEVLGVFFLIKKTADGMYKKVSRHIIIENGSITEQDVETKPVSKYQVPEEFRLNAMSANTDEIDQTQYYGELLKAELSSAN